LRSGSFRILSVFFITFWIVFVNSFASSIACLFSV
jgi:hypothetical protein